MGSTQFPLHEWMIYSTSCCCLRQVESPRTNRNPQLMAISPFWGGSSQWIVDEKSQRPTPLPSTGTVLKPSSRVFLRIDLITGMHDSPDCYVLPLSSGVATDTSGRSWILMPTSWHPPATDVKRSPLSNAYKQDYNWEFPSSNRQHLYCCVLHPTAHLTTQVGRPSEDSGLVWFVL